MTDRKMDSGTAMKILEQLSVWLTARFQGELTRLAARYETTAEKLERLSAEQDAVQTAIALAMDKLRDVKEPAPATGQDDIVIDY